jgi:hypothetical protein
MLALYFLYSGAAFTLSYGAHLLRSARGLTRAATAGRMSDA